MADSEKINLLKKLNELQNDLNAKMKSTADRNERILLQEESIANQKRFQSEYDKLINDIKNKNISLTTAEEDEFKKILKLQKEYTSELDKQQIRKQRNLRISQEIQRQLKIGWKYLQQQDKTIKSTILTLGMSGAKAQLMRESFQESAGYVARLGGNLEDVSKITTGFADETGRARVMTAQMIQDVALIGKGTGLGVEQATRLAAQFEFMGLDANRTMEYVQGVVDTSERMGVNTTKVLKSISDNFKKLSTFTFQSGVKGFAKMAQDAEKTRVSMATALNVAEATRNLESVIELGANLQVMGGRFAEMDPFQWLYMVRNEPEKLNEQISKMTEGIYTLKRNSEGIFEKFISPADRDRLAQVAKSLGIAQDEMFEIAQRSLDLSIMEKELAGLGLSDREKELIEGAAFFNSESGKYQVRLAGTMQDISTMTKTQALAFGKQQESLEARALEAQTFDEAFKATINELKSALLPILNAVNGLLTAIRPTVIFLTEWATSGPAAWLKVGALFMSAGALWKGLLQPLMGRIGKATVGRAAAAIAGGGVKATADSTLSGSQALGQGKGAGLASKGAGMKALGVGAGVGAAAAGVGGGIMMAAKGISELADAMSKLTPEQSRNLAVIGTTLAVTFPLAAVGIALAAKAAESGIVGLLALGAAVVAIGFGIKLATDGIGNMAEGLAKMNKTGGGAGNQLLGVAAGIGAITLAMASGGVLGVAAFNKQLRKMNENSDGIQKVGAAFANINAVLSGTKEDWVAIESAIKGISSANVKGGGVIGELATLLKQPLKVQFADKQLAVVSNITMEIDGEKIFKKTYKSPASVEREEDVRAGKSAE